MVVSGKKLENKMIDAINLLCDTVKLTLGPKGNNVIINPSDFSPFITNDGVTIALNITSDDKVENTILELAKEASIKTNLEVGDGTTTTLVIFQSLYLLSLEYIRKGISPLLLKKELEEVLKKILEILNENKLSSSNKNVQNIACISANDKELGLKVSEIFEKVSDKNAIFIKEISENIINISYFEGYSCFVDVVSPYFFKGKNSLVYKEALILIIDNELLEIESISIVLNEVMDNKKNLIIIANDFSEYFVNQIISLSLNDGLSCCLLKVAEYGLKQKMIHQDLEIISNAKIIHDINKAVFLDSIGKITNVVINNDQMRMSFKKNKKISNYVLNIKSQLKEISDDFEDKFYIKRIAMFTECLVQIEIGAPTILERREKRMRLEDAISAVYSARDGVLLGCGVSLLQIIPYIDNNSNAGQIWREVLTKPFEQVMFNSALDYENIQKKIEGSNFSILYNVNNNKYEKVSETKVIDSLQVISKALINACSIATMLLTTTSLVINERVDNSKQLKENIEI